jgi:diaminopimelate decarboxylase
MLLEYRNSRLHWAGVDLLSLAERFGTPLHVCCREALQESALAFRRPFEDAGLNLGYRYSVKTNPIPEMIRILKESGFGVEIISPYELWLVNRLDFAGDDIVVTGLEPDVEFCLSAAQARPKMWVLESEGQLQFIDSISRRLPGPINVGIRICPTLRTSRFNLTVSNASHHSPYGFLPDSAAFSSALDTIAENDKFKFAGFHFHIGSGIHWSRPYEQAFNVISDVILSAAKRGFKCRLINIGGGFGSSTAPVRGVADLIRSFLGFGKGKRAAQPRRDLLDEIASALKRFVAALNKRGVDIDEILVEPGRAISGPAQMILLTVKDIVERAGNRRFLICDAGAMSLSPSLLVEDHRIMPLRQDSGEPVGYTILGSMPTPLDIVASSAQLPKMSRGDRMAVLDTGAYFYSFNNNFAGPRPAVALIDDGQFKLIRGREDFEDISAYDAESRQDRPIPNDTEG